MFHSAAADADMHINRDYICLGWTDLHKSSAHAAISSGNLLFIDTERAPCRSRRLSSMQKRACVWYLAERAGGDRGRRDDWCWGLMIYVTSRYCWCCQLSQCYRTTAELRRARDCDAYQRSLCTTQFNYRFLLVYRYSHQWQYDAVNHHDIRSS